MEGNKPDTVKLQLKNQLIGEGVGLSQASGSAMSVRRFLMFLRLFVKSAQSVHQVQTRRTENR